MLTQTLLIHLPLDYRYPQILKSSTSEDNAFILDIGCRALSMSKDERYKKDYEDLYNSLRDQAKNEVQPKLEVAMAEMNRLQQFLKEEQQKYENAQKIHALAHETEIQTLQQACAHQAKQFQSQLESLQTRLYESTNLVREEEKKNREELLKEKDMRIQSLEQNIYSAMMDMNRSVLTVKDQILKVSTNSNRKGKSSENSFTELLQKVFGATSMTEEFELQQVGSSESRSGDIKMLWRGGKLMWEVKDYSKPVPKEEVQKFQRDMGSSTDINLGVFVSLSTPILGKTKAGDIDLEILHDGRVCIYLNEFNKQEDQVFYLQSLMPFLEFFLKHVKTKTVGEDDDGKEELKKLQDTAKIVLSLIQKHKKGLSEFKNFLQQTKKKFDTQWDEMKVKLTELDMSTEYILNALLSTSEEYAPTPIASPTETAVPMEEEVEKTIFKPYSIETLTPNERKFIDVLTKMFIFKEGSKLSTLDVKKPLQDVGLSEESIKKCRDKLILESIWERGKAFVYNLEQKN